MSIEIQQATEEQTPLILEFIQELAKYEKLEDEVLATESALRNSLFGENASAEALFAYHDNKAVGFAIFFENFSAFQGTKGLYLDNIYVKPSARGLGIGQKILNFLTKVASERNCSRLEWWCLDWNTPAINFYHRIGAEPMKEWTVYRMNKKALSHFQQQD